MQILMLRSRRMPLLCTEFSTLSHFYSNGVSPFLCIGGHYSSWQTKQHNSNTSNDALTKESKTVERSPLGSYLHVLYKTGSLKGTRPCRTIHWGMDFIWQQVNGRLGARTGDESKEWQLITPLYCLHKWSCATALTVILLCSFRLGWHHNVSHQ